MAKSPRYGTEATVATAQSTADSKGKIGSFSTPESVVVEGTTTNPTTGTRSSDEISIRQLGSEGEIRINLSQLNSVGTAGSGQYLFTLPDGKQWDSSVTLFTGTTVFHAVQMFTGLELTVAAPSPNVTFNVFVVPYDSTRFRLSIGAGVTDGGVGNAATMNYVGSADAPLSNGYWQLKGSFVAPIAGWTATS